MNMKKLLALLLALVMVLSMAACSDSDESDEKEETKEETKEEKEVTLVGTWEGKFDLSDAFNEMMGTYMGEYGEFFKFDDLAFIVRVTYEDDGTYTAEFDEGSIEDMVEGMKSDLEEGMIAMMEAEIEAQGLDMTVEEMLEMSGMSMDDLTAALEEEMDTEAMIEELTGSAEDMEGEYVLEDDKLYMYDDEKDEDDYVVIEMDSDSLTFVEASDASMDDDTAAIMESLFPLEFERVD